MAKFNKFDKANLKALRAEMQAVLNKYGVTSNLEIEVGNMRFSDAEVDIKVKAKVKGATTMTDKMLEMAAANAGIKSFKNAKGDELVKYNSRSYKYPFVYKAVNGGMYKCSEQQAKILFAA